MTNDDVAIADEVDRAATAAGVDGTNELTEEQLEPPPVAVEADAATGLDPSGEPVGAPAAEQMPLPMGPTGELTWRMQALLEETLLPSPNGVELNRSPMHDYLNRLQPRSPHIAELFQENTKICTWSNVNTKLDTGVMVSTREWYFTSSYRPRAGDFDQASSHAHHIQLPVDHFDAAVGGLLTDLATEKPASDLLFGIDVWALFGDEIYRVVPRSTTIWLEKRLLPSELTGLSQAILELSDEDISRAAALLFVVPVPWRYMLLQGPRGYRRSLVDAGRFLAWCEQRAAGSLRVTVAMDFLDHRVDSALSVDGVERSTLAIVALESPSEATR